jgi:hypothetical protein
MTDLRSIAEFNKDEAIRIEQQITLQYRFAAGHHATRFFTALKDEGKILATRDGQKQLAEAMDKLHHSICPQCLEDDDSGDSHSH